jgi:PLD-like domain/Trypsin-like peptidase domain
MRCTVGDLAQARNRILANDPELAAQVRKVADAKRKPSWLSEAAKGLRDMSQLPATEAAAPDFELESIVQRVGRPVFAVMSGKVDLDTTSGEAGVWNARLQQASAVIGPAIAAVGRVEATNWPMGLPYIGTGWLIEQNLIVTNRHVALEFAERGQKGFVFQLGFDRRNPVAVDVDFLEEIDNVATARFTIGDILYIASDTEPDVAFLRVAPGKGPIGRPIKLGSQLLPSKTMVGVVGYPGRDPRIPDQTLMAKIFGNVFDKKRFAPGFATGFEADALTHDCTTLGGNSGSVVLDLLTGEAAALHFSGVFLKTNYSVPAPVISQLLSRAKQAASITGSSSSAALAPDATSSNVSANSNQAGDTMTSTTIVVPLQITISLANPVGSGSDLNLSVLPGSTAKGLASGASKPPSLDALNAGVVEGRRTLLNRADVISIKPGYRVADGWITDERCLVVSVKKKLEPAELAAAGLTPLPESINGIPVDVAVGTVADRESHLMLEAMQKARHELIGNYQKPADMPLVELNEPMQVAAHAGPDAGWPQLEPFLGRVKKQLTIGMYEFTAPHVVKSCVAAIKPAGCKTSLVLQNRDEKKDGTTIDDLTEQATVDELTKAARKRLSFAWASVSGPDRLFATSYHIKVAVRDQREMWLSSGSWRSSNQAPFDPIKDGDQSPPLLQRYDRDWHILLVNKRLATLMEKYLLRDEKQAAALEEALAPAMPEPEFWVSEAYFRATDDEAKVAVKYRPPLNINRKVRVQPLLTPDNYAEHVLPLIQNATKSVYFQNQSLDARASGENGDVFESLLKALLDKQKNQGIDVRIIFRRFPTMRQTLTGMKDFGFDTSKTKVRVQTNCHTKGIIIDGETAVVGSHNWTRAGTTLNRDASLIFFDPDIARYYQDLFLFDWNRIANVGIDESLPAPEAVRPEEGRIEPGMVKLPVSELWDG